MLNKLIFLVIFSFLFVSTIVKSQEGDPLIDNWPDMQQVKKMVSIKWEPAGKNIRIFLTGYEAAKLDFSDFSLEVTSEASNPNLGFAVQKEKNSFLVNDAINSNKLKVKVKIKEKDALNYDLNLR